MLYFYITSQLKGNDDMYSLESLNTFILAKFPTCQLLYSHIESLEQDEYTYKNPNECTLAL